MVCSLILSDSSSTYFLTRASIWVWSWFVAVFGLEDNFADRYSILCIHMWLCLVRLRSEQKAGKQLAQVIYENFQEDVEMRVRAAGVKVHCTPQAPDK